MDGLPPSNPTQQNGDGAPWYRELNRYHWFVLAVAALGWLFDTMDQQIFNLARVPALRDLLSVDGRSPVQSLVTHWAGLSTAWFLLGWAFGGLVFGFLGDRWGRAKVMLWTILIYSACTGLSALSRNVYDFTFYRFLTGLGVGGEFAVGVALVAEVMPNRARPFALGLLQALSAVGNIMAGLLGALFSYLEFVGVVPTAWKAMFVIGAAPALLAVVIRSKLKEPDRWKEKVEAKKASAGSYAELLGHPRWRKNSIVGLLLATSGVLSLWGIVFFSVDLQKAVFRRAVESRYRANGFENGNSPLAKDRDLVSAVVAAPNADIVSALEPKKLLSPSEHPGMAEAIWVKLRASLERGAEVTRESLLADAPTSDAKIGNRSDWEVYLQSPGSPPDAAALAAEVGRVNARSREIEYELNLWSALTLIMLNVGGFFGMNAFAYFTHSVGRKPAFFVAFLLAAGSTILVFSSFNQPAHVFWMIPLMGFFQLALFGGYAIYLPELFPTHLRSTGTSLCYNAGRIISASGPIALSQLTQFYEGKPEPLRYAGITMCCVYLIGLAALPFAEETRGRELPE